MSFPGAGYVIEKRLNATDKWFKAATLEPTVTQYSVENLKEKSEYFFKICAENYVGLSEPVETKLVSLLTHASECIRFYYLFVLILLVLSYSRQEFT